MKRWVCLELVIVSLGWSVAWAADVPLGIMPAWTTSEQNINSTGMVWRDLDRDGIIDVFFSNGNDITRSANNIYLFGPGAPPYSASWYSGNLEYSGKCAVGDINDDGYPDIMVANYLGSGFNDPNRSDLYINEGGLPGPNPAWYTPNEMYAFSCAFGDVDNDGDLDVAFATGDGYYGHYQPNIIFRNDGGAFSNTVAWSSAINDAAVDVTWGDVDRDGDLDLAFTGDGAATSVYYNNAGTIESTPSWHASTTESGNTVVFGDINGDGWLDLVVAYNNQLNGQGRFRVYFNNGDGTLNPTYGWQSATGGYGSALALYDYDNDGDDDLAAGRWFQPIWVYENLGTTLTTTPIWTSSIDMVPEKMAWVDIDAHGVLALADTLVVDGSRKLFYVRHHPLYEIDSVVVDGAKLGDAGYCYDLVSGWLSLASAPTDEAVCFYRYSFMNDLTVANWDTVNMAFPNTKPPFVDMSADVNLGKAPLSVQFQDMSIGAYEWNWSFGDGFTSQQQNPQHNYSSPGNFDVTLEIATPERPYSRKILDMVSVYADTLTMAPGELVGQKARVDVVLRNYLPLSEIVIPFTWAGNFSLRLDSVSVVGLRTGYFDTHGLISLVPATKSATVRLAAGSKPLLDAGNGPVVALFFTDIGAASVGSSPIAFTEYSSYSLELVTFAGAYGPESIDGVVFIDCCVGRVGDANGVGGDEPSIGDVSVMIDAKFITGTCEGVLPCLSEADINQSGGVDPACDDISIGDISILIDYLFITGPLLGLDECF